MNFSLPARRWLGRWTGLAPHDVNISQLAGATSSALFLVQSSGSDALWVLRVLDNAAWLRAEPDLAAHEAAALQEAQNTLLTAPQPIAFTNDAAIFGAPAVLMSYLEGRVELRPSDFSRWLEALARQLAQLHGHRAPDFAWHFRSWLDLDALTPPLWTNAARLWERAIEAAHQTPPHEATVWIHRDFHPVNVLWRGETVSGVVDWINACQGAASVDVAHCRTNLAQMFGVGAADEFLSSYRHYAGDFAHHPYWDICSRVWSS